MKLARTGAAGPSRAKQSDPEPEEIEDTMLEAELQRRLALPPEHWEPAAALGTLTSKSREHLLRLKEVRFPYQH